MFSLMVSTKRHTGFLGVDLEAMAGRPVSCSVEASNFNKVVGVGLHTIQPGVVLPAVYRHPLGPSLAVFLSPPELHLRHRGAEVSGWDPTPAWCTQLAFTALIKADL